MHFRRALNPERRNPCTHVTITRLFDQWGSFKCCLCHKHAEIGWLYRCTQDSNGFLPAGDFINDSHALTNKSTFQDVALHTLSSPIIKAISDGQYTDEQIKILIQQKEKVRDIILAQEPRPVTASTATTSSSSASSSSSKYDSPSTLLKSTTFSTTSTASLDEEIRKADDWNELQKVWMSEPTMPLPDSTSPTLTQSHLTSHNPVPALNACSFKICPTCRPTYRDRGFQSLNAILNSPVKVPPSWELENRPISDASVLAKVQVPSHVQVSTTLSRFYTRLSKNGMQSAATLRSLDNLDEELSFLRAEIAAVDKHSIRKRSGFRQTVRNALARARSEDSTKALSANENEMPVQVGTVESRYSRSHIFGRPRSRPTPSFIETHGQLVDTSALQDSVMLMLASNTPLPHTPSAVFDPVHEVINSPLQDAHGRMDLEMWDLYARLHSMT